VCSSDLALNDINLMVADIQNAYLQASTSQKHYIVCDTEFGIENAIKQVLIHCALYEGKTCDLVWISFLDLSHVLLLIHVYR
jgi:hypothetical protein